MARRNHARRKTKPKPRLHRRTRPGALPGVLVTDPTAPRPQIRVIAYGPEHVAEEEIRDLARLAEYVGKHPVAWIQVTGLGDAEIIRRLGERFDLHPLALEDVVNVHQRAKVDQYGDRLFIVARTVAMRDPLRFDQVSLFVGKDFVLTFQERPDECFAPVHERLRAAGSRIRTAGPDYLAYALLDAAIDSYFPALDQVGERLDSLDQRASPRNADEVIARLHDLRSDLLVLRRAIWPHRDAVNELIRDPHPLIGGEARIHLRDCYDHAVQIIDLLETYREMCADLRELVFSMVNNRLNEIMKVLTIIATIFMPLGFIASLYGMNFDPQASPWNMPELKWPWGYPLALSMMAAVAAGLVFFFWRRGWLGSSENNHSARQPDEPPPPGD